MLATRLALLVLLVLPLALGGCNSRSDDALETDDEASFSYPTKWEKPSSPDESSEPDDRVRREPEDTREMRVGQANYDVHREAARMRSEAAALAREQREAELRERRLNTNRWRSGASMFDIAMSDPYRRAPRGCAATNFGCPGDAQIQQVVLQQR